ncbi:MAG: DNA recombination protein RmuC [Lewinellaceae bacterium]|nr:DNA recombination protein RmuC [Saprospiraceae bacterium]MCB9342555.1 DNA recombination protein RmuC [Lewinellaceae bacterium]
MEPEMLILIGVCVLVVFVLFFLRQQKNGSGQFLDKSLFVSKELHEEKISQIKELQSELSVKEDELRSALSQLAAKEQQVFHLDQSLSQQKGELEKMEQRFKTEFENIANRLLEEKSLRFTEQNAKNMQSVLLPLREKIKEFEENIDRKFLEETREKTTLKEEIKQLHNLNQQLSVDAHNLATALKGQSKVQGDWGEMQLETLLEKSGLQKGIHFLSQATFRDEEGAAKRPDFVIQLPDDKQLIIDSKVSLSAYERYFNAEDTNQRDQHLKAHVASIRSHVDNLSKTNYQTLYQINSPDYLLLFVPLDSALSTASQADPQLFHDALERNIVLVSTSTLLATMRTVAHLWKQEKQSRSVLEIARQSGLLYDKFVAFVEDLRTIGNRLDNARTAYDDAMNKLVNASRPGDTLVGKAQKIKELGARATKQLPQEIIDQTEEVTE